MKSVTLILLSDIYLRTNDSGASMKCEIFNWNVDLRYLTKLGKDTSLHH